jgi:hypothetical protein
MINISLLNCKDNANYLKAIPTSASIEVSAINSDFIVDNLVMPINSGFTYTGDLKARVDITGVTGPTANNRVLIAQITTDGILSYALNIQIGTPTGGVERYVHTGATGSEIDIPSLSGTLGAPNTLPTVSITSPADGTGFITGSTINVAATAADAATPGTHGHATRHQANRGQASADDSAYKAEKIGILRSHFFEVLNITPTFNLRVKNFAFFV